MADMAGSGSSDLLNYGSPLIDDDDVDAVVRVLRSGWLTTGPTIEAFEKAFASHVGARHAVVCSSGTAALHLAILATGIRDGDAAIVPSITFLATANCARYVGAEVKFVDVNPETGLMAVDEAIPLMSDPSVKVVLPVHFGGQTVDLPALWREASERRVMVIEDACHALGTTYQSGNETIKVGSCAHSDMCVFSLHPVKTIAAGEGGVITTNNADLARAMRRYRSHGIEREADLMVHQDFARDSSGVSNPWYYEMPELGFNYRASDIHCALGLSQLAKVDHFVDCRRALVDVYDELLEPLHPVIRPLSKVLGNRAGWHLYVVRVDFEAVRLSRAVVMARLRERGVGSQVHYVPVHLQPYYQSRYGELCLPGAEEYYQQALTLPLHVGLKPADIAYVVETLAAVLDGK